jgi:hypothetical protein
LDTSCQVVADDEIEALEIPGEVFRSIMSGARHPDVPLPCPARVRARLSQRRTTLSAAFLVFPMGGGSLAERAA